MTDQHIEIDVVLSIEDGLVLGYFSKGHADLDEWVAAAERNLDRSEYPGADAAELPTHQWWRCVPRMYGGRFEGMAFQPAEAGARGAFKVTSDWTPPWGITW